MIKYFEDLYRKDLIGRIAAMKASCLFEEMKNTLLFLLKDPIIAEALKDESSPFLQRLLDIALAGYIVVFDFIEEFPQLLDSPENRDVEKSLNKKEWYVKQLKEFKSKIDIDAKKGLFSTTNRGIREYGLSIIDGYDSAINGDREVNNGYNDGDGHFRFYLNQWIEGFRIAKYIPIYEDALNKLNNTTMSGTNTNKSIAENIRVNNIETIEPIRWMQSKSTLEYLLQQLSIEKFIDEDINQIINKHFVDENGKVFKIKKSVLIDELPKEERQSIRWNSEKMLLIYLLDQLKIKTFINRETRVDAILLKHFVDKKGDVFKDNIKQNRTNIGKSSGFKQKPKYKTLEKIIIAASNH